LDGILEETICIYGRVKQKGNDLGHFRVISPHIHNYIN